MDIPCFLVSVAVGACVALVASAVLLLFGGYGGYLRSHAAINTLYDEAARIEGRLEKEIKARAATTVKPKVDPVVEEIANRVREGSLPNREASRGQLLTRFRNTRGG